MVEATLPWVTKLLYLSFPVVTRGYGRIFDKTGEEGLGGTGSGPNDQTNQRINQLVEPATKAR